MVKHIVLWRLHDDIVGPTQHKHPATIKNALFGMLGSIP